MSRERVERFVERISESESVSMLRVEIGGKYFAGVIVRSSENVLLSKDLGVKLRGFYRRRCDDDN